MTCLGPVGEHGIAVGGGEATYSQSGSESEDNPQTKEHTTVCVSARESTKWITSANT